MMSYSIHQSDALSFKAILRPVIANKVWVKGVECFIIYENKQPSFRCPITLSIIQQAKPSYYQDRGTENEFFNFENDFQM